MSVLLNTPVRELSSGEANNAMMMTPHHTTTSTSKISPGKQDLQELLASASKQQREEQEAAAQKAAAAAAAAAMATKEIPSKRLSASPPPFIPAHLQNQHQEHSPNVPAYNHQHQGFVHNNNIQNFYPHQQQQQQYGNNNFSYQQHQQGNGSRYYNNNNNHRHHNNNNNYQNHHHMNNNVAPANNNFNTTNTATNNNQLLNQMMLMMMMQMNSGSNNNNNNAMMQQMMMMLSTMMQQQQAQQPHYQYQHGADGLDCHCPICSYYRMQATTSSNNTNNASAQMMMNMMQQMMQQPTTTTSTASQQQSPSSNYSKSPSVAAQQRGGSTSVSPAATSTQRTQMNNNNNIAHSAAKEQNNSTSVSPAARQPSTSNVNNNNATATIKNLFPSPENNNNTTTTSAANPMAMMQQMMMMMNQVPSQQQQLSPSPTASTTSSHASPIMTARDAMIQFRASAGHIAEIACTHAGKNMIQSALRTQHPEIVASCLAEFIAGLDQVAADHHGCNVLRSLIEVLSEQQADALAASMSESVVLSIATTSLHTRRVLETLFERHHANSSNHLQPIVDIVSTNANYLSQTQQGCISLMRVFERGTDAQKHSIVEPLLPNFANLAMDKFGNYVVQCVLVNSNDVTRAQYVLAGLKGSFIALANNKFSSNALESVVRNATLPVRKAIVKEIFESEASLEKVAEDQFGNFVLQTIVSNTSEVEEYKMINSMVRSILGRTPFAKRLDQKLKHAEQIVKATAAGLGIQFLTSEEENSQKASSSPQSMSPNAAAANLATAVSPHAQQRKH